MWLRQYYPTACYKNNPKDTRSMRRYAEYENNRQWQDVFNRLVSIVVNIFEWENLPDTCDPYFMEMMLLWRGTCCILNDTDMGGFLSLPCTVASQQNLYYENSFWRATSLGYTKKFIALTKWNKDIIQKVTMQFDKDTSVIGCVCHDNIMDYSMAETVRIYTDKLVDVMRSIDVMVKQLKIGSLIETDEDSKLAIQNAIQAIDSNVLAVYARRDIAKTIRESKTISVGSTPQALTTLWDTYNNILSEFLTAFGINNLNTADKKERLIVDEVNSNNEQIQLNAAYRLDQRLHFCENFNAVFGTNISCRIKHDYNESLTNKGTSTVSVKSQEKGEDD